MTNFAIERISREGCSRRVVSAEAVTESLRWFGLEWKTADWAHDQAVTIVIRPAYPEEKQTGP